MSFHFGIALVSALLLCVASAAPLSITDDKASLLNNFADSSFPLPFTRELGLQDGGNDVRILNALVARSGCESAPALGKYYDINTQQCVKYAQRVNNIDVTGRCDAKTLAIFLQQYSRDGYKDSGSVPKGYHYKIHVPVYEDRSIETTASLIATNGTVLFQFRARTHGQNAPDGTALNQFSSSGSTPTGLSKLDLNTPEDDPASYGPYDVNRAVTGIEGNALVLLPTVRNGILVHTGEWSGWKPSMNMPNSHGCIHAHPEDIKQLDSIIQSLGVVAHKNPFGQLPYPFKPQGVLSVEQLD